jgi:putative oxidoreductase
MRYRKIAGIVLLWALQLFAALAFVNIGVGKFVSPFWIKAFARWGYSDDFRILIGVLEIAGGILLAIPQTTVYAAALVDVIMIGAAGTLLLNGVPSRQISAPIVWMVLASGLAFARRRRTWRPARRSARVTAGTV